ncbi:hypothetical protein KVG88_01550 [Pseudomonas sp. SWRI74]|uniref:Lipoprotein n=1 Tax=Pseudomonas azerbaijanoccidentalis TaxID=2842347 RepID=A0ABS6QIE7_9PSED|nr:hypothetical protein [Pseudomonas azerbaijanoccidentalis]MBV4518730.1 hypothetical protein [Pseudomonas azerbaijanoccidentalis]
MSFLRVLTLALSFAVGLLAAQGVVADSLATPMIKFAENSDGGGDTCGLPLETSRVDFRSDDHGCVNDQMTYFRLENAPSATNFRLESEKCDGSTQEWYFQLKTYINPVSTGWVSIPSLVSAAEGEIVVRGVMLVNKKINTSVPTEGKLSCVDIKRSPLP